MAPSALRVCALLAILAAGTSLPVPPKLSVLKSHRLSAASDTNFGNGLENELMEFYDDGLVAPSQCEDYCSLTYPTHTYPVVENHLACRQGCILMQVGTQRNICSLECSLLYNKTEDEQYACKVGCNVTVPKRAKQSKLVQTLVVVSTIKTSKLGLSLFHLKENLKHLFWRAKEPKTDSHFQWDQPQQIHLGKGQEVFVLSGNFETQGDLMTNDLLSQNWPSILPRQALSSFSHPSLVYMSKSVVVKMKSNVFVSALLCGCVFLLLIGVPFLLVSSVLESKKRREDDSEEKTTVVRFKLPPCTDSPHTVSKKDSIGTEFIAQKSPISLPVAVLFE